MNFVAFENCQPAAPAQKELTNHPNPEFIRLPRPGDQCPYCGLSRSAINELILPSRRNGFKPVVKSFCLRQRGAKTGIRLVSYDSLRAYILKHAEPCIEDEKSKAKEDSQA